MGGLYGGLRRKESPVGDVKLPFLSDEDPLHALDEL